MTDPAPYITADDIRTALGYGETDPSDERIEALVAEFENIAERAIGYALTPRTATESVCVRDRYVIVDECYVTAVTAATRDGNSVNVSTLTIVDGRLGKIKMPAWGDWTITYTYGLAAPPAPILLACQDFVRATAKFDSSAIARDSGRALVAAANGNGSGEVSGIISVAVDWEKGNYTTIPAVNRRLQDQRNRTNPIIG